MNALISCTNELTCIYRHDKDVSVAAEKAAQLWTAAFYFGMLEKKIVKRFEDS